MSELANRRPASVAAATALPLRISGLTVGFPDPGGLRLAVDDVSLTVGRGEVVALVGESGSGKTLTSLSAIGLLPAAARRLAGRVEVLGEDVTDWTQRRWRSLRGPSVGMVFQEPLSALNPVLTIGDQLGEAVRHATGLGRRDAGVRALALAQRVGLPDAAAVLKQYPHQLSGGMRQRVVIAGAVAGSPRLLIADEPTTALDSTVQRQILDLLLDLVHETGAGLLLVTHDFGLVAHAADRVVVMRSGRTLESAPVTEVFDAPQAPYTRELIRLAPRVVEAAASAPAVIASPRTRVLEASPDTGDREAPRQPLLSVRGLTKVFSSDGSRRGIRDATFDLDAGSTLGVVGESGSGKSTLARTLVGLHEPDEGEIRLDGQLITSPRDRLPGVMQMVFQDPYSSLNPRLPLWRIVTEPLTGSRSLSRRDGMDAAAVALEEVGLAADLLRRHSHELSGGQRQRVGIARALISRPRVVALDEPVSALDVSVQARILALIEDLQRHHGFAAVFIGHGLSSVYRLATSIAVVKGGEIVDQGPRDRVFFAPAHPHTRELLSAVLSPDPRLRDSGSARSHSPTRRRNDVVYA